MLRTCGSRASRDELGGAYLPGDQVMVLERGQRPIRLPDLNPRDLAYSAHPIGVLPTSTIVPSQ